MQRLTKGQLATLPKENIRNDSWVERTLLTWVYPLIGQGRAGTLEQQKLRMPQNQATEVASEKFQAHWKQQLEQQPASPSITKALIKAFGWEFALAGVFKMLWSAFVILGAYYFVTTLIDFVQPGRVGSIPVDAIPNKGVGWILASMFFLDSVLSGVALQRMGDVSVRLGIKIRAALITALYRKSFKINSATNHDAGNVVSLVSTDCIKMYEGVQHAHNVWTAPLEAAAIIALLLYRTGGVYGLPALGVVLVVLPLQFYFGMQIARYKMKNVEVSDARVLRMHEVLLAIKLVKFYVWEHRFAGQVEEVS